MICLCSIEDLAVLGCDHRFCFQCISAWALQTNRHDLLPKSPSSQLVLDASAAFPALMLRIYARSRRRCPLCKREFSAIVRPGPTSAVVPVAPSELRPDDPAAGNELYSSSGWGYDDGSSSDPVVEWSEEDEAVTRARRLPACAVSC